MNLTQIYQTLHAHLGHQNWWPGETQLEIAVGAILTQNTNWQNVEKAITQLKAAGALDLAVLDGMPPESLAQLIRPAGYFNIKAKRLKNFVHHIVSNYAGDLQAFLALSTSQLREELLAIKGVGPETADSIALYAGGHPLFVVDAYTHRILVRHGWLEPEANYFEVQDFFQSQLPDDVSLYNDFHAQIVMVGKHWCKRRKPDCENCPLKEFLPEEGPITGAQ